jgi:O-antigen ligase
MPTTHSIHQRPSEAGGQWIRPALLFLVLAGMGVIMGVMVDTPNKRLIEAVAGGIFLLVALMLHISFSLGVLLALLPFPAGTYYGTSNELLILALIVVYAVKQMIRKEQIFRRTPIDIPVLLMVAATLLALTHQQGSLKPIWTQIRSFFSAIALYYLIVAGCTDRTHVKRLLVGYMIAVGAASLVAVFQMFFPGTTLIPKFIYVPEEERFANYVRAAGTFGNYSTFGQYMALNMILTSYLFIRSRSPYAKMLFMSLLVMASGTFLSSAMRGALFAMGLGMVYLAVIGKGEVKVREWLVMLVSIVVIVAILGSVMLSYMGTGYLFERLRGFSLERGSPTSRLEMNQYFLEESLNHPFFGHGLYIDVEVGIGGARSTNPHNQYIRYLYTMGVVGLVGFVWLVIKLYLYSLRATRDPKTKDAWTRGLVTVFHTMFLVFAVHESIDDYMQVRLYQHIIWSMFAILVVLSRLALEPGPVGPNMNTLVDPRRAGNRVSH